MKHKMTMTLHHQTLIKRDNPSQIKKLPRYRGFRTREYIPVVFRVSATWPRVLRPEVPRGANPTVKKRSPRPARETSRQAVCQGRSGWSGEAAPGWLHNAAKNNTARK